MRIAVVVSRFPVLSETFIIEQLSGLVERGHDVTVHSLGPGDPDLDHPLIQRHGLMERVRYAPPQPVGFLASARMVLEHLARGTHGSRSRLLASLNPIRHGWEVRSLRLFAAVLGTADAEPYDVICAQFGTIGRLTIMLREVGAIRGPIATVFHGFDLSSQIERRGPRFYDELLRQGELFLPVNEPFANTLRSLGADPARIRVLHVGVDCQWHSFAPQDIPEEGALRLLSISRLVEKKGIEFAIRSVAELRRRVSRPIRYRVIGGGPLRSALENLVRELGLNDSVELAGPQTPAAVRQSLQDSHILLAPSVTAAHGDKEGIPVVLMEAMASGISVVSTRHSGIPELVQHRVTGLLAPERDPETLADHVEWLLRNPVGRRSLCRDARRHVELEFNSAQQADRLVALLEGISVSPPLDRPEINR